MDVLLVVLGLVGAVALGIAAGYIYSRSKAKTRQAEARAAVQRRYNTGERSDAQARRVHGFLMRRGYSAVVSAEIAHSYRWETNEL